MNLIINTLTKNWHISTMETLGTNEVLIKDYDITNIDLKNSQNYIVNDTLDGLEINQQVIQIEQDNAISDAIQNHLDTKAQEFRYDNMMSARSYTGYTNAFQVEAQALATWASECWVVAGQIEADVKAGNRPMPTVDEVLAELPVYSVV